MTELSNQILPLGLAGLVGLFIGLQLILTAAILMSLRASARERSQLNKEMFGLVKRIEGLTSNRREQMLKHYDGMLEMLSTRLPPTIAAHTSQVIIDTESKILNRLAELEPNLRDDETSRKKMDELIASMEHLEQSIVASASDTVQRVMAEGRRSLLDDDKYADLTLAA
jgi:hypothetical protein